MFNPLSLFQGSKKVVHPVVLLSLDGWGVAPASKGNAISRAKTPFMDSFPTIYPHTQLIASGESVGLPANEVGNSEVGHLTMGAGRVILQSLKRINQSITDASFYENPALLKAIYNTQAKNSRLHILGLLGLGNVHASLAHLNALIELMRRKKITNAAFHLFTDGRDSPPREGAQLIGELENKLKILGVGRVTSVCGRYFGMDRDTRWPRTQKAYDMMVLGKGKPYPSAQAALSDAYAHALTDEFVEPSIVLDQEGRAITINDHDSLIFYNFRTDRPRQLTMALTLPDFENLKGIEIQPDFAHGKTRKSRLSGPTFIREKVPQDLCLVTMTSYLASLPVAGVAFPISEVVSPLSGVIADQQFAQYHLAESEKETMVSYYFDGLRENPFPKEDVTIIPSQRIPQYDKKPQMSVQGLVKNFIQTIGRGEYHFYMLNIANPDMVAHTGNLNATIKALEYTDWAIGEIVKHAVKQQGTVFITADHGNAEELLTYPKANYFFTTAHGDMNTDHSNNPVPFYCIAEEWKGNPRILPQGSLSDVAPTILARLGIAVPTVMTGRNLLK